MKPINRKLERRILLTLGVLLIANPVILYMLTKSIFLAISLSIISIILAQLSYRHFGNGLPTVYLLNFYGVLAVFTHGEVVFENIFSDYVIEDLYLLREGYYFNKPELNSHLEDKEFSVDYLTNEDGFRIGYSNHANMSFDSVDILVIGDSYTQGAQVDFEDLYTTHLYRKFPDKIIANAGVSGLGLPQELELYKDMGRKLKPNLVVLQISAFNDFMNVQPSRTGVSDYLANRSDFIRFLLQDIKYQNPSSLPLGRWTEPFQPTEQENIDHNIFYVDTSPNKDGDIQAFENYFRDFVEAVYGDGADLLIVLLPTKEQISFRYLEEVVEGFDIPLEKLDMRKPNRMVRNLAEKYHVNVLDAYDLFQMAEEDPYLEYDEHLSPYGHLLLAERLQEVLAERNSFRTTSTMLSQEYSGDRYPFWSSESGWIYYQSWARGGFELFQSDLRFETTAQLTFNDVDEAHPWVSSDGSEVVFTEGNPETGHTRVARINLLTGSRDYITEPDNEFGAIPSMSQDGQRIAYAQWSRVEGSDTLSVPKIVVKDLQTQEIEVISREGIEAWRPVFSLDGEKLAFISRTESGGDQFELFLSDLNGSPPRRLTDSTYDEWDPRFSPDGTQIVYSAKKEGNWDLFLLNLGEDEADGLPIRLTKTLGDEWDPTFGSSSDEILFAGEYGIFRGIYKISSITKAASLVAGR